MEKEKKTSHQDNNKEMSDSQKGDNKEERRHKRSKDRDGGKKKRRHKRSTKSRSRSRSRNKDRDRKHRRKHHRDRSREKRESKRERQRNRKKSVERQKKVDQNKFNLNNQQAQQRNNLSEREYQQLRDLENTIKEAQREVQEQKRDQLTVLVLQIPLRAREKHIYKFFAKAKCGKIRDIRLIRDPRSGTSKGIAYVEFFDENSVMKAISLNGKGLKNFEGCTLKVQPSQAEKNRAAQAAKKLKAAKNAMTRSAPENQSKRIYVGGLVGKAPKGLEDIQRQDLKSIFCQFGDCESIDIYRDPVTEKCLGFAFIQYTTRDAARKAIKAMQGFTINVEHEGQTYQCPIVVTKYENHHQQMEKGNFQIDLDTDQNKYLQTAQSRAIVSQKLARLHQNSRNRQPSIVTKYQKSHPTNCILLLNMFKQSDIDPSDKTFFPELEYEVKDEMKRYGSVRKLFVNSKSNGQIWVLFKDINGATKAHTRLNNRYFNDAKIECYFVDEENFGGR